MSRDQQEVQVRAGTENDIGALTDIYNHYVRETAITFDTDPFTPEQRRPWLRSHPVDGIHRLLVAQSSTEEAGGGTSGEPGQEPAPRGPAGPRPAGPPRPSGPGRILGYATSSPFRPKAAYGTSVEVSVYCAPDLTQHGIGTLLYQALFEALADEAARHDSLHRAYAGIALPNTPSERLHARFGFTHVGTFREVGRKFGRYWDVAWYEKPL
ncbi:GNAT family N-acetyltransferase [Streptomyces zagrosensis]|uniref:Phosphinothricin acetyltransferase n=1 Tax=Streptomyces zagrosensis TaxID=1042984 RepID=A0A7W9QHM5_9ACTN|nr:GNAT family N-acetyltransferase [Streptomyces zagrosensis]MBB5939823.1 phosphinothricin acetyltransferase [Streptomyces zagrosensis]